MTAARQARSILRLALPESAPTPHLSEEEIADYHRDRLAAPDQERVVDHLAHCRECSELLLAFADLTAPEAAEPLSEFELAAAWRVVRPAAGAAPATPRRFAWQALAASLLLTTAGAAFYAQRLGQELAHSRAPELNTPVVDLYATGVRSALPEAGPVELPPEASRLTLVLNPERRESFADYELEIRSAAGELLWQARGLEKNSFGSFTVTLPRSTLEAQPLSLALFGLGQGSPRVPLGNYRLELASP